MITGDMIVDYEMAMPDEFINFYENVMVESLLEKQLKEVE